MKVLSTLLSVSLFTLLFILFFHPITAITQDLGRHIKTGEIILQTHTVPKTNLFSYTYPDYPFINTHWLSEVVFYVVSQVVGFQGLLVFTTMIVLAAFAIIFYTAYRSFLPPILISLLYFGILA